jgi:HEAT repeat protein
MARKDSISHLGRHSTPSPTLVREVVALGKAALPRLCALVTDRAGWAPEGTFANNAARSAIYVLRLIRDPDAVPALVEAFTEAPVDGAVVRSAAWALPAFGAAVVEPILPHATAGSRWIEATELLAECGVRDERIVQRILAVLAVAPLPGAEAARSYGDPTLIGALQATFDAAVPAGDGTAEEIDVLVALLDVILELGHPDEARAHRLQVVFSRYKATVQKKQEMLSEMKAVLSDLGAAGVDVSKDGTLNRVAAEVVRRRGR